MKTQKQIIEEVLKELNKKHPILLHNIIDEGELRLSLEEKKRELLYLIEKTITLTLQKFEKMIDNEIKKIKQIKKQTRGKEHRLKEQGK